MIKRTLKVAYLLSCMKFATKAFDGDGAPDGGNTDEQNASVTEFDESSIPAEMQKSFSKYKQTLIDKGVTIGTARTTDKFNKSKGAEVDNFLTQNGLTKDDVDFVKGFAGKRNSLSAIFDEFGTEDFDEIASIISSSKKNKPSVDNNNHPDFNASDYMDADGNPYDMDAIFSDMQNAIDENASLSAQVDALKQQLETATAEFEEKEATAYNFVEKMVVGNAIKQAAVSAGAYDPEDVMDRVGSSIIMECSKDGDFIPVVVDSEGTKRFNSNGDPYTVQELVNEFLDSRPHLKKSTIPSGTGSNGGQAKPATVAGKYTQEQLKDPKFFQDHYKDIMAAVSSGKFKL